MNVTDPVCGMSIESTKAAAQESFKGETYYFCSAHCRDEFKRAPEKFAGHTVKAKGCCGGHDH